MRTVVTATLKADFAEGVIRQVFFQRLPFLQKAEAVQLCSDLCAGMEEDFAGGMVGGNAWLSRLADFGDDLVSSGNLSTARSHGRIFGHYYFV